MSFDGYMHYTPPCFDDDEVIITEDGLTTETKESAKYVFPSHRVTVPTFRIYQNPTVRISDVKQRRFAMIDRAVQKARQEIMSQEDDAIFKALDIIESGNKDI